VFHPADGEKQKEGNEMKEVMKVAGALLVAFAMLFITGYGV